MVVSATSSQLTTQATTIDRVKYFGVELYLAGMLPNTTYSATINGQDVGAFCKPFGGNLGSPLTSDETGKLIIQYMMSVSYNQSYVVNPVASNNNLVSTQQIITFTDPFGKASSTVLPLLFKSSVS